MIEAGSQRAQRLFSLHFARFPAWPPAPARGCGQRRRRSRRPPQRRQQESPPPPIEAMLRRSEMTKTERCAGGNILAMRCRFAVEQGSGVGVGGENLELPDGHVVRGLFLFHPSLLSESSSSGSQRKESPSRFLHIAQWHGVGQFVLLSRPVTRPRSLGRVIVDDDCLMPKIERTTIDV